MNMTTKVYGDGWLGREVNEGFVTELKSTAEYLLETEKFNFMLCNRTGTTKSDLTKLYPKIKTASDVLLGAPSIDNFSLSKLDGDFQGTLVVYKNRLVFVSSMVYQLKSYEQHKKIAELEAILVDLRMRAKGGLEFAGTPDNFYLTKSGNFSREGVVSFLQSVKESLSGLKLRARV